MWTGLYSNNLGECMNSRLSGLCKSRARRVGAILTSACLVGGTAVGLVATSAVSAGAAPSCGSACYVSASSGNDTNAGTSASPLKTIQAGIDAVSAGGTVFVRPGAYSETATVTPNTIGGTYDFGLYLGKNNITVQGVHADDSPITNHADAAIPTVETNSTANFGPDGVFVEGDHDTIAGISIGENVSGCNKTIEVVGDAFTFRNGVVNDPCGGSLYIDDFRYDEPSDTPYINSYTITGSAFGPDNSIDIGNGPGHGTAASKRQITNNVFQGEDYWPAISFNGAGSGIAWFVYPVGGATITGNKFWANQNQYIRARGIYDTNTFNWTNYFTKNTFPGGSLTMMPNGGVRTYAYSGGGANWNAVRRINGTLQDSHNAGCAGNDSNGDIANAHPGDTIKVQGTFSESLTLNKAVSLLGVHAPGQVSGARLKGPGTGTGITVNSPGALSIRYLNVLGFPTSVAVASGSVSPKINRDGIKKVTSAATNQVNATCNWWGSKNGPKASQTSGSGSIKTHPFLPNSLLFTGKCGG